MAKKTKGPVFLRFIPPVLETLKTLGGSGTAGDVTDEVVQRMRLSKEEQAETTASGQSRVRNQIGWARFYLSKAGILRGSQRGVWALTRKGHDVRLDDEEAVFRLFRGVHEQYKKVLNDPQGTGPLPDEEEEFPVLRDMLGVVKPSELGVEEEKDEIGIDEPSELGVEEEKDETGSDEIHSPYDPSKTHIVTKPMSIEQLAKRLGYEEIDLAPDFQRKADLWTDEKKSRLIESMLIRIPLPVFYFDATDDTKWLVVDGLQRLSTIRHFMVLKDARLRLRLQGLEYLRQHEGKIFEDLPRDLQRRIEETQVFAHLIQPGTPIEVKYNIFKRINTGGLVLTAQEIRHALYQKKGGATDLLRELADGAEFLVATDGAIDRERMLDCEFVLRFVSFSMTSYTSYSEANMDAFLNRHMKRLNDDGEGPARDDLRRRFRQAMRAAQDIFGKDAFRKRYAVTDRRKPINKALFEVWSVALGNLDAASLGKLCQRKEALNAALMETLRIDQGFDAAITQATRDVRRVHKRFSTIEHLIRGTLRDGS